jgi:SOS-response transcriptional repressor LexA
MNLGKLIRRRRESLGLTQDDVAGRAGISKPYLSNIETGRAKNPPTDAVLERLEHALALEPYQLMHAADLARTPPYVLNEFENRGMKIERYERALRTLLQRDEQTGLDAADLESLIEQLSLEEHTPGPYESGMVPIINRTAAGDPQEFTDLEYPPGVAEAYLRVPDFTDPQAFAIRVEGDSMQPAFREDDIVVFAPNRQARPGEDCFVRFGAGQGTTFKRYYQDNAETIRLQPLNAAYPSKTYPVEEITGLYPAAFRIVNLHATRTKR